MKKDILYAVLDYSDGVEQILLNKGKNSMSSHEFLNFLRDGIKTKELKDVRRIQNDEITKYIFDVKSYDTENGNHSKNKIVVVVKNSQKPYVARTIASLNDICTMTAQIKKVNITRVIAGISAGLVILTTTGPTIAKELANCIRKSNEYDLRPSITAYNDYIANKEPTKEEIAEANERYYEDLFEKAKAGDKAAIREYNEYLSEQQLKEEIESESKTR